MSDGELLLAAVRNNPEEDTPRLAFADWLQEHGDPDRAEFIRLECALAQTSRGTHGARAKALWATHQQRWQAALPRIQVSAGPWTPVAGSSRPSRSGILPRWLARRA